MSNWQQDDMFPETLSEEAQQEALYQQAIRAPLEQKIEMAIGLIRTFEKQALTFSVDGYYVCFSGGKDSVVLERLFEMAGVRYQAWYNNVTIDPPELIWFIKNHYPEVKWNNPEKHLLTHMQEKPKGLPTRLVRWCCQIYKEQGGGDVFKAIGVRAQESARRKGLWQVFKVHTETKRPILSPILYWTDDDIWNFIRQNDLPYCSLYDEGFKRLGCVGCPMGGRNGRKRDFARWPRYERMWKNAAFKWFDHWKQIPKRDGSPRLVTFTDKEQYWSWWMEEKNVNDTTDADCQMYLW